MKNRHTIQFVKYLVVGAASNTAGYCTYLLLTYFALPPKTAMTLLYITTAALSFFGNKRTTFAHEGRLFGAGVRYIIAQALGYLINLAILMVFVDQLGYNHQIVQATAIVTVAFYLFFSLKLFVFRSAN
ncbi:GtrA family protein [Pseudomonas fluorescens]|uniref:GtrA family protein n=1 Tax=Pseudomonas fluorescens TaxID=294 RepID=UPI001240B576|nr:GtrA family protein [Pseudomonas fluorescens]